MVILYTILHPSRAYSSPFTREMLLDEFKKHFEKTKPPWAVYGYQEWIFDLQQLRVSFPELNDLTWLVGRIKIQANFDTYRAPMDKEAEIYHYRGTRQSIYFNF